MCSDVPVPCEGALRGVTGEFSMHVCTQAGNSVLKQVVCRMKAVPRMRDTQSCAVGVPLYYQHCLCGAALFTSFPGWLVA